MKWIYCPNCGHKLFFADLSDGTSAKLETKCHSCKAVSTITLEGKRVHSTIK